MGLMTLTTAIPIRVIKTRELQEYQGVCVCVCVFVCVCACVCLCTVLMYTINRSIVYYILYIFIQPNMPPTYDHTPQIL